MKDKIHLYSFIYIIIATVLFSALSFMFCSDTCLIQLQSLRSGFGSVNQTVAIFVSAVILALITFEISTYLARIAWSNRLQLLAYLPTLALFFAQTRSDYLYAGTIGVLLMLICLNLRQKIQNKYIRRIYTIITTLLLYWIVGPIAMFFALTILVSRFSPFAFFPFVISFLLAGITLRLGHEGDLSHLLSPLGFYTSDSDVSSSFAWMPWVLWLAVLSVGLTIRHYRIPQWITKHLTFIQFVIVITYALAGSMLFVR